MKSKKENLDHWQILISDLINESKLFQRFENLADVKLNYDSEVFNEIEEFIAKKLIQLEQEKNNQ